MARNRPQTERASVDTGGRYHDFLNGDRRESAPFGTWVPKLHADFAYPLALRQRTPTGT